MFLCRIMVAVCKMLDLILPNTVEYRKDEVTRRMQKGIGTEDQIVVVMSRVHSCILGEC